MWEYDANLVELLRVVTYGVGVGSNDADDGAQKQRNERDKMSTTKKQELLAAVAAHKYGRSAWSRGVQAYAVELVEGINDGADLANEVMLQKELLNGAQSWAQYSEGGCALIYDADICERLCSPSEVKRSNWGMRAPNGRETWLEVQACALWQAHRMIEGEWRNLKGGAL